MSTDELRQGLRHELAALLEQAASKLVDVQVVAIDVERGDVQCRRRAMGLGRKLLASRVSTAEIEMLVVFDKEAEEDRLDMERFVESSARILRVEPLSVPDSVEDSIDLAVSSPPPAESKSDGGVHVGVIIGAACGGVVVILLLVVALLRCRSKKTAERSPDAEIVASAVFAKAGGARRSTVDKEKLMAEIQGDKAVEEEGSPAKNHRRSTSSQHQASRSHRGSTISHPTASRNQRGSTVSQDALFGH
eukprot:3716023-Rhodomonas_salina.1